MATKLKHGAAKGLYAGKHPAWQPSKPATKRYAKARRTPDRAGYRK